MTIHSHLVDCTRSNVRPEVLCLIFQQLLYIAEVFCVETFSR